MPKTDILARFLQAVSSECRLDPRQPVLLGVSGGADSVALLALFCWLNEQPDWAIPLHVAHLNHQLRGAEGDGDAEFVATLARELRVPCITEQADVTARAETDGLSIEHAGRQCRFDFFERTCLQRDIHTVVLAHHADDNAETILHRVIRGTGLRGLGGIRPQRPLREGSDIRVVRPLLSIRRADIEAYLIERGMIWREDASNRSPTHTRNRLRHEVLPLLREQFNPQIDDALLRLSEQARAVSEHLVETSERMLDAIVLAHDSQQIVLHCPPLLRKPRVIQTHLILRALLRLGAAEGELSTAHLNAVADLAAGQEGSKSLDLPAGLRVSRRYTRLVLERPSEEPVTSTQSGEIRVALEGLTALPGFGLEIRVERFPADEQTIAAHIGRHAERGQFVCEEWLDAGSVHPPLTARSRRPGDRFLPLGMTGMKKISDLLIDEKIEASLRERVLVLCDQLGPIWVVPLRIDERVRLTGTTRAVLRLSVQPTQEQ